MIVNRKPPWSVLFSVRVLFGFIGAVAALLLAACSSSRTIGREQELPLGNHVAKTVKNSDFLVPQGSRLLVDYSSESRYFVESGGVLSGFPKGAELTTIYAEDGAMIPNARSQGGVRVRTVKDATESYRSRYQELPPAGMDTGQAGGAEVIPVVGVGGFWGNWGFGRGWGRGWGRGRGRTGGGGRSVSVRPSSYRRSN